MDDFLEAQAFLQALVKKIGSFYSRFNQKLLNRKMEVIGMEEPNLETLIRDLYNHARQNLSEDLVAALLETAKQLPSTNERLLAVRLSGLVTLELLKNPRTPAPELVNLARYIKKEEARYKGAAASSFMIGELFKML